MIYLGVGVAAYLALGIVLTRWLSVRAPGPSEAVEWAERCRAAGLAVGCFRPPSVPDGISRLRLSARADLTDAQVAEVIETVVRTAPGR